MNFNFNFVMAILCGDFTTGVSRNLPWLGTVHEFHDYIFSFIMDNFPDECVCFFVDPKYNSSLFAKLVENVGKMKMVTLLSPLEQEIPINMFKQEPLKPYPCSYVIHLPFVGSAMPWLLLRGRYFPSGYHLNELRYLIVAEHFHSRQEIEQVLFNMFSYGFLHVDFLNFGNAQADVYTLFPFGKDLKSCPDDSLVIEKVATWWNEELQQYSPMFPKKLPDGPFNGCFWNISAPFFTPYLMVDNGGLFRGPVEGYDAGPLSLMAERLNLTPQWNIDLPHLWSHTYENGTIAGSVPDLVLGRGAQMSCGGLSLYWTVGTIDATMFYTWSSIQWFAAAPNKVPKWQMLVFALNKSIWPFVLSLSLIVPTIYWVFCILCKRPQSFSHILLSFTALSFGNFTSPPPVISTLRFVFLSWLIYVLHIDQLYLASLTGLITSAGYEPMMRTAEELIDSNLPTVGYIYTKGSLETSPKESIQKLAKNFIVFEGRMNGTLQKMSKFKNFTIADNQVFVRHILSTLSNMSIYPTLVTQDEYTMSALMWRHNYLFERINTLFIRMFDAGFPVYFLKKFTKQNQFWSDPMDKTARALTLVDLSGPFYVLIIGLSLSFVVFLCEVLVFTFVMKPKEIGISKFLH